MEVGTLIYANKKITGLILDYFNHLPKIKNEGEDDGTYYFINEMNNKYEFYLHLDNDVEEEFRINFSEQEVGFLRRKLEDRELFLVDISFRDYRYFVETITNFITKVIELGEVLHDKIFYNDPFEGIMKYENNKLVTIGKTGGRAIN
jgi:hypothetical protein